MYCYTSHVSFVVQFWRRRKTKTSAAVAVVAVAVAVAAAVDTSSDSSSCSEEEIILEVQRRQGCSYAMHKIRTALKKSIQWSSSSSACSNNNFRPMIRYEKLVQTQQNRPFKPPISQMINKMILRQQRRWSALPARPSSSLVLVADDESMFTATTATPSSFERNKKPHRQTDCMHD